MTLVLELAPEEERELEAAARNAGQSVSDYALRLLREANEAQRAEIARKLAALDELDKLIQSLPNHRAAAGLPPIGDTSRNAEPDIYGYSEREANQL